MLVPEHQDSGGVCKVTSRSDNPMVAVAFIARRFFRKAAGMVAQLLRKSDWRKFSPSPRPSPPGEGEARTVPGNFRALWCGIASWGLASQIIPILASFPVFAGGPFVGAPEPSKPPKESPLSAEEQLATFTVPPGFRVELVAAEPDGGKFVGITFDHAGRMWTMTAFEYPLDANETPAEARALFDRAGRRHHLQQDQARSVHAGRETLRDHRLGSVQHLGPGHRPAGRNLHSGSQRSRLADDALSRRSVLSALRRRCAPPLLAALPEARRTRDGRHRPERPRLERWWRQFSRRLSRHLLRRQSHHGPDSGNSVVPRC